MFFPCGTVPYCIYHGVAASLVVFTYYGSKAPETWCLYLTESAIYYWMPILFDLLIQRYAISDIADGAYGIIITLKETTSDCCLCCSGLCRYPVIISIRCCENGFASMEAVKYAH